MNLERILGMAVEVQPGLWKAGDPASDVSYPETGHRNLAAVEEDSYWFRHRADVLSVLLDRYPPGGVVLDIGGGNGYMVRVIRESGHEALLLEPGLDGCRTALERDLGPVLCGTTSDFGIPAGSIPAVGLFDVVEHIKDDRGFMRHIHELMAPSGRLYISVPAFPALWSGSDETAGHYRRYRRATIADLVETTGFEIEYTSYLFRILTLPLLLLRTIPFRVGLRSARAASTEAHRLPSGAVGGRMRESLGREVNRISSGRTVGWGTSVVVVASKPR